MHPSNGNFNYKKYYEDLGFHKWERVISEENIDDEECKERQASQHMFGQIQSIQPPINSNMSQPGGGNDHHGHMQPHHMQSSWVNISR